MTKELALPIVLHLAAALPAVVLGVVQLARKKGTFSHRFLGWAWVAAGLGALAPGRLLSQLLF